MKITSVYKLILLTIMLTYGTLSATTFTSQSSITLANLYLFRGFDLSQEDPALQGDYIVSHESGFWFGAWATNYDVAWDDGIEIDLVAGYDISLTEDLQLTLGMTEYTYTGETENSTEFYAALAFSQFSISYYQDVDLDTVYLSADAEFVVTENFSVTFHAAQYDYEILDSSRDYSITLNYTVNDQFSVFATYSNNDLNVTGAENYLLAGLSYSF